MLYTTELGRKWAFIWYFAGFSGAPLVYKTTPPNVCLHTVDKQYKSGRILIFSMCAVINTLKIYL